MKLLKEKEDNASRTIRWELTHGEGPGIRMRRHEPQTGLEPRVRRGHSLCTVSEQILRDAPGLSAPGDGAGR